MRSLRIVGHLVVITLALVAVLSPETRAQWVQFVDATDTVLSVDQELVAGDLEEKDYAWGDIDNDGDVDLIIVRKEPFTTVGKRTNVLLINENGVLTDRTAEFATATDIPGDMGFLTPTNDRDVVLADLDLDGWLDMVTAATLSDTDPKHIGHPRIYMNRGCAGACQGTDDWLGFIYEEARIPALLTYEGESGWNPRLCAVSAGDVTGDGWPDLYFSDYDEGVIDPFPGPDFNDRLLVNTGSLSPGYFTDVTSERFFGEVPGTGQSLVVSNFGAANVIVDLSGDGMNDIVKHTALGAPYYVGVGYNGPDVAGFFDTYDSVHEGAPYFVNAGELNNDGRPELIITEDGADRYLMNQGNGADTITNFLPMVFSFSHLGIGAASSDDGFGGNSLVVDLNSDGWNDVLITDVDVDVPGCIRRMHIYRNLGGTPGDVPILEEQTTGFNCASFFGNPASCVVASIPSDKLEGVHDVAVFDINGDGWQDMVVGRCTGTEIYTQVPSVPPAGTTSSGTGGPGEQLLVGKSTLPGHITLSWPASCLETDADYAIYEGTLGDFDSHASTLCSTLGATTSTFVPDSGDSYYLVVPSNGLAEGGYGRDSNGAPRPNASTPCLPQNEGACGE